MTAIDGERQPGTIPGLAPGALLDRIDELARLLHRSPMEVVVLAFADYTPAIETAAGETLSEQIAHLDEIASLYSPRRRDTYQLLHPGQRVTIIAASPPGEGPLGSTTASKKLNVTLRKHAPPVEERPDSAPPGDGRGAGGVAATPAPVSARVTACSAGPDGCSEGIAVAYIGPAEVDGYCANHAHLPEPNPAPPPVIAGLGISFPAPVSHAAPAHVHLGGGPCVYGERCGQ